MSEIEVLKTPGEKKLEDMKASVQENQDPDLQEEMEQLVDQREDDDEEQEVIFDEPREDGAQEELS